MPINTTNKPLKKRIINGKEVKKVYQGSQLVWTSSVNPATLGATHWLPFTNSPTEDIGTSPATWGVLNNPTVKDGYLATGTVRNPTGSTWSSMGAHSFSGWIKTVDKGNLFYATVDIGASYSKMSMDFNGSTREVRWAFRRGESSPQMAIAGTLPDEWAFVAMTMEPLSGTNWQYRAYINGREVTSGTYNGGTQSPEATIFPSFSTGSALLDDMAMYKKALTPREVASLYVNGRSGGAVWPKMGHWAGTTLNTSTYEFFPASYTIPEDGYYKLNWSFKLEGTASDGCVALMALKATGELIQGQVGNFPGIYKVEYAGEFKQGNVIEFGGMAMVNTNVAVSDGIWSVEKTTPPPVIQLPTILGMDAAYTSPYRIVLAGSSTTQGYQQPQYEQYAQLMTARIARQCPGANAFKMVKKTSGTHALPSANGFHFLNVGLGGTTSANYMDTAKRNLAVNFQPKFVIHMIGSNDYQQQMAIATYKSNIEAAMNAMQSSYHILVHTYRREDRADTGITWAQYGQALKDIAANRPNATFIDASQDWQTKRAGATDWLQGDKIHTTWQGAQGLAEVVADKMQLQKNVGKTVWGFGQPEITAAGSGATSSMGYSAASLAKVNATQSDANSRPQRNTSGAFLSLSFNYSGARNLDTPGFGAYSFPITFYAVCSGRYTTTENGTVVQPFFSRSVGDDDGWWWVWQDRGVPEIRAALNSAFSPDINYGVDNLPIIYAVHMTANNRASVYVNSKTPRAVLQPENIAEDSGPWMKSIRIGTNSGRTSYTASNFREMSWELSDYEQSDVQARLTQLSSYYRITLDP